MTEEEKIETNANPVGRPISARSPVIIIGRQICVQDEEYKEEDGRKKKRKQWQKKGQKRKKEVKRREERNGCPPRDFGARGKGVTRV